MTAAGSKREDARGEKYKARKVLSEHRTLGVVLLIFILVLYTMYQLNIVSVAGLLTGCAAAVSSIETTKAFDVFDYVDPLIGTINGGEF